MSSQIHTTYRTIQCWLYLHINSTNYSGYYNLGLKFKRLPIGGGNFCLTFFLALHDVMVYFRFSELANWILSTERELKKIKESVNDTTKYKQSKASVGVSPWLVF